MQRESRRTYEPTHYCEWTLVTEVLESETGTAQPRRATPRPAKTTVVLLTALAKAFRRASAGSLWDCRSRLLVLSAAFIAPAPGGPGWGGVARGGIWGCGVSLASATFGRVYLQGGPNRASVKRPLGSSTSTKGLLAWEKMPFLKCNRQEEKRIFFKKKILV